MEERREIKATLWGRPRPCPGRGWGRSRESGWSQETEFVPHTPYVPLLAPLVPGRWTSDSHRRHCHVSLNRTHTLSTCLFPSQISDPMWVAQPNKTPENQACASASCLSKILR